MWNQKAGRALAFDKNKLVPRLRRAFLAGAVALVAIALTFVGLSAVHRAGWRWVQESRESARLSRQAHTLATDRETGLRGYLLSGKEISLAPDLAARPLLRVKLDSLLAMTAVRSRQHERAKGIHEAVARWEEGYATPTLARARKYGIDSIPESDLAGTALFDSVRSAFEAFQNAEERSYTRLVAIQNFLEKAAFGAVMLEIVLLLAVLFGLRRGVLGQATDLIQQQERLEEQAQELEAQTAELEEQTEMLEEQTDEAGSIARSLETANHALADTVARLEKSHEAVEGATREKQETLMLLDVVLESSPIGFAFHDRNLRYTRINPALAAMSGLTAGEHVGRTPAEVHPDVASLVEPILSRVLATGEAVINVPISRSVENGSVAEHHFLASFFPVKAANGETEGVGAVVLETTARRQLEDQLLQAQKMEAIGRLAGGVAHDFNNILTAIKSYSELLIEDMAAGKGRLEDVQEIREAADRAATLTRQLLAFSRQQMLRPRVLDLNTTVRDLKNMLDRIIGAHIELNTRLAPDLGMLTADPGQIEQILMNLVVNAHDAMPEGGRLDIETANVELDGEYARTHAATSPGPYVMLAVTDSGQGMSRETQKRIFEPFFTTKENGQGTGLGLSTVYGIVKQSGGSIWVYSEVGRGTTFKIYLPRVNASVEHRPVAVTGDTRGGKETILLVEDEVSVRAVAGRILRRNGYTVVEASNGIDALRECEERGTEVDLIVTDIVMPEMGGFELAKRIRLARPGARILFTSGYTEAAVLRRSFVEPGEAFLEKPFTPARLAQRAREVLDGPPPLPPVKAVATDG
jgi:two-component system cell cycle sensor histidine kinase/response regulator CckA